MFLEFHTKHVRGLCYVKEGEIHFLNVVTNPHWRGHFRRFVRELKREYSFIRMWATNAAPDPVQFRAILIGYNFTLGHDADNFGQIQEVFDWF